MHTIAQEILSNNIAILAFSTYYHVFIKLGSQQFRSKFTLKYLRVNMSADTKVKKAMLSTDKILVDENNLEILPNSIIHCLGSLFQLPMQDWDML